MTFEDFASQVFSPSPGYPMSGTGEKWTTPWFGIMFFSTPSLYLPYLSVHFIVASPHLGTFFSSLPHLPLPLFLPLSPCQSLILLHTCSFPLPPFRPPPCLHSTSTPTLTDEYQTRGRLFTLSDRLQTLCFLHFLKPHSRYLVHVFLFQTASFCAITFL